MLPIRAIECALCYCLHPTAFLQDNEAKEGGAKPSKAAKPATKKSAGAADEAKAAKAAEKQRQAQLEMLMMDDNALQDLARIGNNVCFVALAESFKWWVSI